MLKIRIIQLYATAIDIAVVLFLKKQLYLAKKRPTGSQIKLCFPVFTAIIRFQMAESRNQKWNKSHSFTQLSATESDIFVKV